MGEGWRTIWGLALLAVAVAMLGCGGDSGTATGSEETSANERPYPHITGAAREFLEPGGDNAIQIFGEEASPAEREKASRVIHAWMKARVAEAWVADCRLLAIEYRENLIWDAGGVTNGRVTTCPGALRYFGDDASGTSGNTLTGPIDSLRVRKTMTGRSELEAFAQWHGPREMDWVLPMRREGGAWRVSVASPIERNK